MELDYKEIGKRVKIARIRADLTQEALAEKAGLSITHMSNIENGHSKLSLPDGGLRWQTSCLFRWMNFCATA